MKQPGTLPARGPAQAPPAPEERVTACAASRPGPWWFRGSVFRLPTSSSAWSRRRAQKYVEFTTLHDPAQMPGQRPGAARRRYWLTVCRRSAAGRGHAPADPACRWFLWRGNAEPEWRADPAGGAVESTVSRVPNPSLRIRFVEQQPISTWMKSGPREYGVLLQRQSDRGPSRWSQAAERRIGGDSLFSPKRKDAAVQQSCRTGGVALHQHGCEEVFLMAMPATGLNGSLGREAVVVRCRTPGSITGQDICFCCFSNSG